MYVILDTQTQKPVPNIEPKATRMEFIQLRKKMNAAVGYGRFLIVPVSKLHDH